MNFIMIIIIIIIIFLIIFYFLNKNKNKTQCEFKGITNNNPYISSFAVFNGNQPINLSDPNAISSLPSSYNSVYAIWIDNTIKNTLPNITQNVSLTNQNQIESLTISTDGQIKITNCS